MLFIRRRPDFDSLLRAVGPRSARERVSRRWRRRQEVPLEPLVTAREQQREDLRSAHGQTIRPTLAIDAREVIFERIKMSLERDVLRVEAC
jgi:hypothetical protein